MALSDKLNILFPVEVDESSIDVTPAAVSTLPEENVFNSRRDKFMRVTGTSAVIKINTVELTAVSGIAISHNLDAGSTIKIRLRNEYYEIVSTAIYDSGDIALDIDDSLGDLIPQIFFHSFAEKDIKAVLIDISAPTNTEIDIGRIMVGTVFEPGYNFSQGMKWRWVDDGDERTAGNKYRLFDLILRYLSNAENDIYENEKIKVGKQGDVFVCLQPSATGTELLKSSAFCRIVNDILRDRYRTNTNRQSDTFKEVY